MGLQDIANLAEIIGLVLVIGGLTFGIAQVSEYRRQRRDMAAIELARTWHNPGFARAMQRVLSLPASASAATIEDDVDVRDAALLVTMTIETVGIMVHRRIVDYEMVWELMGGMILTATDRLGDWIEVVREQQSNPKFSEWNQWLAERLGELEEQGVAPAQIKYRNWRP